ncbi:hypothetical protein ACFYWU_42085 [Streptomyces chrestomyceticus]|uniref:hypothetical protein n=1 Tax=Streptomyces chrestomyceticus TaxID=68185 RepID=UPI003689E889
MAAPYGRGQAHVDFGIQDEQGVALHDYVPVTTAGELDQLIRDLRGTAASLEQWRERLPPAAA